MTAVLLLSALVSSLRACCETIKLSRQHQISAPGAIDSALHAHQVLGHADVDKVQLATILHVFVQGYCNICDARFRLTSGEARI